MSSDERRYATPGAARRAVSDRLKSEASTSAWRLTDLQRQYAYDQFVERLYRVDDGWVIKGATALLARRMSARHTLDIDVYRPGRIDDVEQQMRDAAALDIGDWMRFEIGETVHLRAHGAEALRAKVSSSIGTALWAAFQIDMVADGVLMTGTPDAVSSLTQVRATTRARTSWRAYPLVDHVADKVCAILERHHGKPSTRFKDLVDLIAISRHATIDARNQTGALFTEARRRLLDLPASFGVPDRDIWERGYRGEARRAIDLDAPNLNSALAQVCPFVDPILDGTALGRWHPDLRAWR